MRSLPLLALLPLVLAACSGAPDTDLFASPGVVPPVDDDAGADAGADVAVLPDAGPCTSEACGLTVPSGFRVVAYAASRKDACPKGTTTRDVVADPVASDGTCSCACNITTQPDCSKGGIARGYDFYNSTIACNSTGYALNANGGACGTFGGNTLQLGNHISTAAPGPTGGACSYDATSDATKVTAKEARLCDAPAGCAGALCSAGNVCVAQDGDVACPAAFAKKTLVGAAPKVTCGACGASCTVDATCTGTLSLFSDGACTNDKLDLPADGQCAARPSAANGKLYSSYAYKGTVKAACAGTAPPSAATVGLDKPVTVCCAK